MEPQTRGFLWPRRQCVVGAASAEVRRQCLDGAVARVEGAQRRSDVSKEWQWRKVHRRVFGCEYLIAEEATRTERPSDTGTGHYPCSR